MNKYFFLVKIKNKKQHPPAYREVFSKPSWVIQKPSEQEYPIRDKDLPYICHIVHSFKEITQHSDVSLIIKKNV